MNEIKKQNNGAMMYPWTKRVEELSEKMSDYFRAQEAKKLEQEIEALTGMYA